MLKNVILSMAGLLIASSFCLAQTEPAKENTHRSYDQKARACKKLAAEQQLTGDELRTFVANCMKG